jgi:hypothetical protein
VGGADWRRKAIIADEKGEVNRDKPTITSLFPAAPNALESSVMSRNPIKKDSGSNSTAE